MFHTLERIRKKTRAERQTIAFGIAGGITGVIFLLWLVSFFAFIENGQESIQSFEPSENIDSFFKSFEETTNLIQRDTGTVREQFQYFTSQLKTPDQNGGAVPAEDIQTTESVSGDSEDGEENVPGAVEITPSGIELIRVEDSLPQDSQSQ